MRRPFSLAVVLLAATACNHVSASDSDGSPPDTPPLVEGCELTAQTSATPTITSGCTLVVRDASACEADRRASGLDGFWLKFSCRVTLSGGADTVQVASDGQPDHTSNYFPTSDACHDDFQPEGHDPNMITPRTMTMTVPRVPTPAGSAMPLGSVGVAVNGVSLFSNVAAPGDDIYAESLSFDECQGHPSGRFIYHYHSEPYSITADDSNLVGVIMDGYPVYGRRDADGSLPVLDTSGGHTDVTPDSTTPVYHYHLNEQTSAADQTVWFVTNGRYAGTPGTCVGC